MASNLSTIGFSFAGEDEFRETMIQCAAAAGAALACPQGRYGIWRSRTGAEIWFHLAHVEAGEIEICGLTPFFEGKSEVDLNFEGVIRRPGDSPFEGAFKGSVVVSADGTETSYPIVFDAVDFAAAEALAVPGRYRVRLSAFARELKAHSDEAAYIEAHGQDGEPRLAAKAFLPVGMFTGDADGGDASETAPASTALFTGRVVEHARLTNEVSGRAFDWLLVETLDATLDVLADPAVVRGEIAEGSTIEASALLFGRILD